MSEYLQITPFDVLFTSTAEQSLFLQQIRVIDDTFNKMVLKLNSARAHVTRIQNVSHVHSRVITRCTEQHIPLQSLLFHFPPGLWELRPMLCS